MSDESSIRLGLPLLQAGQAQKEVYHNEALTLLDLAVQAGVIAVGTDTPPPSPTPGDCWVTGAAPTGAWAGHAHHLAGWTAGGWRFVAPRTGMAVWDAASGTEAVFSAGSWRVGVISTRRIEVAGAQVIGARAAAIADPESGTTIDAEARAAVIAILAALRHHGLIAS